MDWWVFRLVDADPPIVSGLGEARAMDFAELIEAHAYLDFRDERHRVADELARRR